MLLTNPKINGTQTNVPALLNALPRTNPTRFTVSSGSAHTIPPMDGLNGHYQGIAPYNAGVTGGTIANGCISASSTTSSKSGYFSGFSQTAGSDPSVKSVVIPNPNYYHAAGIQMLGDLLAVSLESEDGKYGKGLVAFYNVGNLALPDYLYTLTMPHDKASAVGITTYTDSSGVEQCLLVVYQYDYRHMYVWQAPASGIASGAGWTKKTTYTGDAFHGDQFQNFALVTQKNSTGDVVYLLGFREDEELHLYTVNTTPGSSFGDFRPAGKYIGWSGSDWRLGMGLQIVSTTSMRLFGTAADPSGGSPTNYTFNIYVYGS